MEKEIKISEIVIELGKREIKLTPDEARKLKELLSEMFGKDTIIYRDSWYYRPFYPQYPNYYYTYTTSNYINCGSAGGTSDTFQLKISNSQ
jgi:hypothetical protein